VKGAWPESSPASPGQKKTSCSWRQGYKKESPHDKDWKSAWIDFERFGSLVALVVLALASSALSPHFLQPQNLLNILRQISYTGIIALGMTFVITTGGIDLSVGSLAAFSGSLAILAMNAAAAKGVPEPAGVAIAAVVAIAVGAFGGAANGILITKGALRHSS